MVALQQNNGNCEEKNYDLDDVMTGHIDRSCKRLVPYLSIYIYVSRIN